MSVVKLTSGIAALIWARNPSLKAWRVRDIIEQSVRKVGMNEYLGVEERLNGSWNQFFGYGLINAYTAASAATGQAPSSPIINIELLLNGESLWVSQKTMAEIFDIDRTVITKHLKNIFNDGELDKNQVCAKFAHTANDGKTYNTEFYNLDAIISVGYRVNSKKATEFRMWATKILNSYMTKGFALDDDRFLKGRKS